MLLKPQPKVYTKAKQDIKPLKLICLVVCHGAPEENNLEPSEMHSVLEELENWSEILKGEPEVIHKLAALKAADDQSSDEAIASDDASPAPESSL